MKALSIRPPWAHAIAQLGKRIENRTWATRYRGPLLIHASSTFVRSEFDELAEIIGYRIEPSACASGLIVAIADLVDCVDARLAPGKWTCGPTAWRLRNVRLLRAPVPAKGRLGLWTPTHAIVRRVLASL
ncbi:MAG: ASCH domain-containing protein [Candidatus Eremiobacteraeota bacterium]|nr:ASCH domain-containing protein [Candidatus Eremiobacteraeota bacterium]